MNSNRSTLRHVTIKMPKVKDKERILKAETGKQLVRYRGAPIRLSAAFSAETSQAQREWHNTFKVLKEKHNQEHSIHQGYHSKRRREKEFPKKAKVKGAITTKLALKMLRGLLQTENDHTRHIKIMNIRVCQDGRVGRPSTHLFPWTHQNYNYLESNYENNLKTSRKDFPQLKT